MATDAPHSSIRIGSVPLHVIVVPLPVLCFVAALVTDIIYAATADMHWETASVWLITAGLVLSALAVLSGLIDYIGSRAVRHLPTLWPHVIANGLAIVLSIFNAFVHSRDGYTSVVPTGLTLSVVVVLLLLFSGTMGHRMLVRERAANAR